MTKEEWEIQLLIEKIASIEKEDKINKHYYICEEGTKVLMKLTTFEDANNNNDFDSVYCDLNGKGAIPYLIYNFDFVESETKRYVDIAKENEKIGDSAWLVIKDVSYNWDIG